MPKLLPLEMKFSRWGKAPKNPPKRTKRKEIERQAVLTSELLTMERQTESPINQKKKGGGGERKIRTLSTMACIGIEIKERGEKGEKNVP